jgi:hypothetical protein
MKKTGKGMGASIPTIISNQDEMTRLQKRKETLTVEIDTLTRMLANSPSLARLQYRQAMYEAMLVQGSPTYRTTVLTNLRNVEQEINRVNEMQNRINANRREIRSIDQQLGIDQDEQTQPANITAPVRSVRRGLPQMQAQGKQGKLKIVSVQFPIDSKFDTSVKRLAFIRNKLNVNPIKRAHKTPKYIKYRIQEANQNYKHFTKKYDDVSIIFERAPL